MDSFTKCDLFIITAQNKKKTHNYVGLRTILKQSVQNKNCTLLIIMIITLKTSFFITKFLKWFANYSLFILVENCSLNNIHSKNNTK